MKLLLGILGFFVAPWLVGALTYEATKSGGAVAVMVFGTMVVYIVAAVLIEKQNGEKFKVHVGTLGLNLDYFANYGSNAIGIDLAAKKVFAGSMKKGWVLDFSEISSIQWEDTGGEHPKHAIHVNTRNFDCPKVSVWFGGAKGTREEAYAKLRAALGIA